MSSHTPTPWVAVNIGTKAEPMWSVKAARIAGQPPKHEVAICATGDSPQEMETANAAFIVKAVNNHATLVDVLRSIRQGYSAALMPHDLAMIDAAIQKAQG